MAGSRGHGQARHEGNLVYADAVIITGGFSLPLRLILCGEPQQSVFTAQRKVGSSEV